MDHLTIKDKIENVIIPCHLGIKGLIFDIIITEICDPSHFWYQIKDHGYSEALNALMDDINQFYGSKDSVGCMIPFCLAEPGLHCVSKYQGEWRRSVIILKNPPDKLKVRHIDYATISNVTIKDVYFLKRQWAIIGAQALRGSIANIRPLGEDSTKQWQFGNSWVFWNLVLRRNIIATACSYDKENCILSMNLCETSAFPDIGEELVKNGHGEHFTTDSGEKEWTCTVHSFKSLELGHSISYKEMEQLQYNSINRQNSQSVRFPAPERPLYSNFIPPRRVQNTIHFDENVRPNLPSIWDQNIRPPMPLPSGIKNFLNWNNLKEQNKPDDMLNGHKHSVSPHNITEIPNIACLLPTPKIINLSRGNIEVYKMKDEAWLSPFKFMNEIWRAELPAKPQSLASFKKIIKADIPNGTFDMHSIHCHKYVIPGFLELSNEEFDNIIDVLIPTRLLVVFVLFFRDFLEFSLTETIWSFQK